jgi:N-acetyl-gamma-glutamyl-phosphate reductase
VLFFCFGHGKSERFLAEHDIPAEVKSSTWHRTSVLRQPPDCPLLQPSPRRLCTTFIYGLPELNRMIHPLRAACRQSRLFRHVHPTRTAASAAKMGLLTGDVSVNAITGSTGAGVKPGATTHFSWRNNNMSIYKAFHHQHVPEILQSGHPIATTHGRNRLHPLSR